MRIVSSAIKFQETGSPYWHIVCGKRHCDCFETMFNHKIVYDYIAHSPTNHDFLKSDFLDSDSPGINYNEFTETTCFYPDEAFDMGKQITRICRNYKTR